MGDVSNRALALFFLWMERQGLPLERLTEGTALRVEDLRRPRGRTSWEDFATLSERFEALVGGPAEQRAVGRMFFDPSALAPFKHIAGLVLHPRQIYRYGGPAIGESLFTPLETSLEEPEPNHLVVRLKLRPPHRHVPSFFHICAGNMEVLPTLLGWPHAVVTLEVKPGEARYDVQLVQPARGRLRGIGRVFRALRSPNAVLDEIDALHDEVRKSVETQRRAREDLAASEARWRAVAEAAGETIAILDPDGVVLYVNRTSHLATTQVLGRRAVDFAGPQDRPPVEAAIRAALAGQRVALVAELPAGLLGNGRPVAYAANFGPVVIDDRVVAVAIAAREVTAERAAEAERHELERRVLHAERFESLGLLAGGIAHDFNNLLAVVRGNAEIAGLHVAPGTPARRALDRIEAATTRASELTGQLLTYAGRGTAQRRPLDLSSRVEEMSALLQSVLPKSLRFETRLGRGLPRVEADPLQVQQIVMNLISNAAESLGEGPGTVAIETRVVEVGTATPVSNTLGPSPEPGTYVVLEVTDTGPGIDSSHHDRIFEPFFTTKASGHGLGLAAVAGIVRSHQGAIEVGSTPGGGAAFRVYLPAAARTKYEETPAAVARVEAGGGRGETLLVVDDEPLVRETASTILEHHGYRVLTAADGDEALEIWEARRGEIAAVLLDVAMPGRSGVEVCRLLRERSPGAVVVLTSAHAHVLDTDPCCAPDAFLAKPWGPGDLVRTIASVIPT